MHLMLSRFFMSLSTLLFNIPKYSYSVPINNWFYRLSDKCDDIGMKLYRKTTHYHLVNIEMRLKRAEIFLETFIDDGR